MQINQRSILLHCADDMLHFGCSSDGEILRSCVFYSFTPDFARVGASVRKHVSGTASPNFDVAGGRGSALQYVMYFRLRDDVILPRNRADRCDASTEMSKLSDDGRKVSAQPGRPQDVSLMIDRYAIAV